MNQPQELNIWSRNTPLEKVREGIDALEASMLQGVESGDLVKRLHEGGTEEGDAQCKHYFGDGVYARSLLIPAGTAVVGRIHRQARVCIIAKGVCSFVCEDHRETVEGPWIGEFKAGSKTAVFAHSDVLWIACLGTEITDSRTAFDSLTCGSYEEYSGDDL